MLLQLQHRHFGVTVLADGQQDVAAALAAAKRPAVPEHWVCHGEAPWLRGGAAWLLCDFETSHPGGDHVIVIGRVLRSSRSDRGPLLYHRRFYQSLAPFDTDKRLTVTRPPIEFADRSNA
jgi:flavin reductase (DIM6/NTAB) family NADH-FMN oxidoreductase RutF